MSENQRQSSIPLRIPWYLCIALALIAFPVYSQNIPEPAGADSDAKQSWQPPDLINLPVDWWRQLENSSPEIFQQRMDQFLGSIENAIESLEGENLVNAQNILRSLRSQTDLINVSVQTPASPEFERIPVNDSYTLDQVLALQKQRRDLRERQQISRLRIDQLEQEAALAQQKQGPLLRQYEATDVSSPTRVIVALSRVASKVDFELAEVQQQGFEQSLLITGQQDGLVDQQLEYARTNMVRGEIKLADVENEAEMARNRAANHSEKIAAIRLQLRNILSSSDANPSLELLRKQQLTRTSVQQALAKMQAAFHNARATWYRFSSDILPLDFDIQQTGDAARDLISDTENQVEVWVVASETTLVTQARSASLNTIKNFELAHAAARETLLFIEEIETTSDDLLMVQEILAEQFVGEQSGLGASWTRFSLFVNRISGQVVQFVDFELFIVGERPVTPGGIFKMLVILAFGFALSWFLRHLLERLGKNKKYEKSPAIYTVGRLLHYTIIVAALFAALASLGLDFTNFALVAGALSVGIGFGLQSIVSNLVSGLILLFEGSLRVGDYIELNTGVSGVVKEINTRATIINTNDSVDIVVPNSDFVNNQLTNWTLRESMARMRLPFGVAYGSDKELVRKAALEAAHETEFVLHNMPGREPEVRLVNFGDSSLDFQLLVWVSRAGVRRPQRVNANFLWNLETKLTEYGIEIPFPQRDVHIIQPKNPPATEPADPETT